MHQTLHGYLYFKTALTYTKTIAELDTVPRTNEHACGTAGAHTAPQPESELPPSTGHGYNIEKQLVPLFYTFDSAADTVAAYEFSSLVLICCIGARQTLGCIEGVTETTKLYE